LAHLSSAELPAEFRDTDDAGSPEAPREQSKLARLCQQTSSVLASVLPAPFGGHKRSVLCQFFGQIPFVGGRKQVVAAAAAAVPQSAKQQPSVAPYGSENVFVMQHNQLPPLTMIAPHDRHPIQLVLEQQRRLLSSQVPPIVLPLSPDQNSSQDLRSSASVMDYSYHQRVEAPASPTKGPAREGKLSRVSGGTKPASSSNKTSQLLSTSGWRIFNQIESTSLAPTRAPTRKVSQATGVTEAPEATTTTLGSVESRRANKAQNATIPPPRQADIRESLAEKRSQMANLDLGQLLVMGKPPGYGNHPPQKSDGAETKRNGVQQLSAAITTTTIGKRSDALKSTTRSLGPATESSVRTIEVVAQSNNSSDLTKALVSGSSMQVSLSTTQKPGQDLHQVQKREELVIASINNLTRIAFGSQLRDTVKVINKLIDQQSNLFSGNKMVNETMLTSESEKIDSGEKVARKKSNPSKLAPESGGQQGDSVRLNTSQARKKQIQTSSTKSQPKSTKRPKKQPNKLETQPTASPEAKPYASKNTTLAGEQRSSRYAERKSTPLAHESRRLSAGHTVSRALAFESTSKGERASTLRTENRSMSKSSRDNSSWRLSSTTKALLRRTSKRPASTTVRPSEDPSSKMESMTTQTKYPWLLPDRSLHNSDAFDSVNGGFSTSVEPNGPTRIRKMTTAELPFLGSAKNQALMLDRLENKLEKPARDSLTTLKLSLTTQTSSPVQHSTSGIQMRWTPTFAVTRPTTQSETSSSRLTNITTSSPISMVAESSSPAPLVRETLRQNDLNEARASDTVSKYTTHWNEANELLATTRRLFQQPLPQIANTGEFFSAETIANWPERYQTMMGQALESSRSTPSFQTTRRNGETYESDAGTSTARHKLDSSAVPRTEILAGMKLPAGITILPSNHKLTAPIDQFERKQQLEQHETTVSMREVTDQPMSSGKGELGSASSVADTLIAQSPAETTRENSSLDETTRFPQIHDGLLASGTVSSGSYLDISNGSSLLKPPYLSSLEVEPRRSTPSAESFSRPNVSKKLYELLMPSTRNFVGYQNPMNQQRFNMAALKFLAQNLLSPASSSFNSSTRDRYENYEQHDNGSSRERLLDLIGTEFPSSYYELLANESLEANSTDHQTANSKYGRSFKTSSLLNDLKQLEHRKAAAILAAIRYQVPSPLVRPWDTTSDSSHYNLGLTQINDRFDSGDFLAGPNTTIRESEKQDLLLARVGKAIKSALLKQRVIPRDELEARLNRNKPLVDDQRADGDTSNSDTSKTQAIDDTTDYSPDQGSDRVDSYATASIGSFGKKMHNSSMNWLDKLLFIPPNETRGEASLSDYDLVDLSGKETTTIPQEDRFDSGEPHPKYIRSKDYRAAWNSRILNLKAQLRSQKINAHPSAMMAKLRGLSAQQIESVDENDKIADQKKLMNNSQTQKAANKSPINFECSDRQSGFYPEVGSSCQVSGVAI